jgi:hypothetical protein
LYNFYDSLGDISIPASPMKPPACSSTKKQKSGKKPGLKKRKSLRRSSDNDQSSESLDNNQIFEEDTIEPETKLRRTPRNIKKGKFADEMPPSSGVSLRKRRRQ